MANLNGRIFKYQIPNIPGNFELEIYQDPEHLMVQVQNGVPYLYILVNASNYGETRKHTIVGTGWEIDLEKYYYIGTWQDGPYVWHLLCEWGEG